MQIKKKTRHKFRQHRHLKLQLILSVFLIVTGGIAAWALYEVMSTEAADEWFETNAIENVPVSLPKDDGPHQTEMETWSFNGHLKSESGNLFSFFYTAYVMNNLVSQTVSHASLYSHETGKNYIAQRKFVGNSSIDTEDRFEFIQGDWLMAGGNGNDRLKISTNDFSFDLHVNETQAPIFHGENGIISLNDIDDIYYYTRSRMAISGTLSIGETTEKVTGVSWFGHQWGAFSISQSSRDLFSLQLSDGTDVMIYQFRDEFNRPTYYTGSFSQNGLTETLMEADFTIVPGVKWTSSKSNNTYPIEWTINIPKKNINIKIKSINKDNEFDATLTSYNIYWKGPVNAQGSHTGLGFVELN